MPFDWQGLRFEGPFRRPGDLQAAEGVYVIGCERGSGWGALDIGEAGDVRARVLSHDRKECWRRNCTGDLLYAAHYTPGMDEDGRRSIERRLRTTERPPCGEV